MTKIKVKISHDKTSCINCGTCVILSPEDFANSDDGVVLVDGKASNGLWQKTIEVDDARLTKIKDAADSCPVMAIKFEILKK